MFARRLCFFTRHWAVLAFLPVVAAPPALSQQRAITLDANTANIHYFGPWVLHSSGWDRYLMYFSINSAVQNGRPANFGPSDSGTKGCAGTTDWSDRIWLTWHFGDGKSGSGWNVDDGYGNRPPFLLLTPDASWPGEGGLIGDPTVVYWKGKWHMYYEGTDDCLSASYNRLFHATADSWFGPWTRRGGVVGIFGNPNGSGFSWPTAFVDADGSLTIYYTDGNIRLLAVTPTAADLALCVTQPAICGQSFVAVNGANPVTPDCVKRGNITGTAGAYKLSYERASCIGGPSMGVYQASSSSKLSFPTGLLVVAPAQNSADPNAEDISTGLPMAIVTDGEERIYYTAAGSRFAGPPSNLPQSESIGVYAPTGGPLTATPYVQTPTPQQPDIVWIDDGFPAGASATPNAWWDYSEKLSGFKSHTDDAAAGVHQHYFTGATPPLLPAVGDLLETWVFIDPSRPPREVMLQWNDGTWEHRAFWGTDLIGWGTLGTGSRRSMGALPAFGQWVRLDVPASLVGLEGRPINGMAFTLFDGKAWFDRTGLARASAYYVLAPCRILDTRNANGPVGGPALVSGAWREIPIAGQCGIPASARAVAVNLTAVSPASGGFISAFGAGVNNAAAIYAPAGKVRANSGIFGLSPAGKLTLFSQVPGSVDVILDVSGYFQ